MKIYTIALALAVVAPAVAANGYEYNTNVTSDYYTTKPAVKSGAYKTTTTTRKNGGYSNSIQNNFYYPAPQGTRATSSYEVVPAQTTTTTTYSSNYNGDYRTRYDDRSYDDGYVVREKQTTTRTYSTQERKYFLAHPFFQPLKGKFGSVTDFAYATNNFKFNLIDGYVLDLDQNNSTYGQVIGGPGSVDVDGKAQTTQFLIKEDFSYGITDTLAVIGMVQYDSTKTKFKDYSDGSPSDSYSSSGLNLFGIGLQDRFVDNDEWIAMISAYYQHQKDTANTFIGELKAGYKIDRTTVYGLLRAGYSRLTKGNIYGAYVEDGDDYMMLSYKTDTRDIFQIEGGLGAFAVLNKYFTLNGELVYGHYDWHEQLNIKGAIGWQPGDMFALNLYAMTSLYDSADSKTKDFFIYEVNPDGYATSAAYTIGNYKIKDYNEWKIGVQAILYF